MCTACIATYAPFYITSGKWPISDSVDNSRFSGIMMTVFYSEMRDLGLTDLCVGGHSIEHWREEHSVTCQLVTFKSYDHRI